MPNKVYSAGTVVDSGSLNDFNGVAYNILGDGTTAPALKSQARTNLGLGQVATQTIVPVSMGGTGISTGVAEAKCRLIKGTTNIFLVPLDGNTLSFPAGVNAVIPSAGVQLAPTGLTPSTLYYIYAVQTAGTVTALEASTTNFAPDVTTGITVKNGDPLRVLVGMVYVVTGPAFVDTLAQRLVASYYNRRITLAISAMSSNYSTASTTQVINPNLTPPEFLSWNDESPSIGFQGTASNNNTGSVSWTGLGLDGVAASYILQSYSQSYTANAFSSANCVGPVAPLSVGRHSVCLVNWVNGGTGMWIQGGSLSVLNKQ